MAFYRFLVMDKESFLDSNKTKDNIANPFSFRLSTWCCA